MDNLHEIIQTLDETDIKDFSLFINRLKKKGDRKDLELFNLLQNNSTDKGELLYTLYPRDHNRVAYHATRKRLLKQLSDFLSIKRINDDTTAASQIMSLYSMSQYLFERKSDRIAWTHLLKAEKLAIKSQQYALLQNIYSTQVQQSDSQHAPALDEILIKKTNNKLLLEEEDNANTANYVIKSKIKSAFTSGATIDLHEIVTETLKTYNLTNTASTNPRIFYNIIAITRSVILASKDFYSFEPYIIEKFRTLKPYFTKHNHYYKVQLLYMISHTLYRNKKFSEAQLYLEKLQAALLEYNKSHFLQLYAKYTLLKAQTLCFQNKLPEAIRLLEEYLHSKELKVDQEQKLNAFINLSVFYFLKQDYNAALNLFNQIQHSDKWCVKKMGMEWLMKKLLIEILVHYELGNIDLVESRIRSIERNFSELLSQKKYTRVVTFLAFVKLIMNKPDEATAPQFKERVEGSFDWVPKEMEDLQAMMFFGWIKSKMKQRSYYQVVLDLANIDIPSE